MLVNKVDRLLSLINKDDEYNTFSKNERRSFTKNQYFLHSHDDKMQNFEKNHNKNTLNIRRSINYTIQSFQLIKGCVLFQKKNRSHNS